VVQHKGDKNVGIDYPIMQGPFGGGLSSPELVAAVSNAGGLGGYGAYTLSPQEIFEINKKIQAATNKPYNINLWVSDSDVPDGSVTNEQYEQAGKIFKPYFDELGIAFPEKPAHLHLDLKTSCRSYSIFAPECSALYSVFRLLPY
jgi:nitronate monooxygenase